MIGNGYEFDISVVVPTWNRAKILDRTLIALASQQLGDCRAEVVIVDDGSSDATEQVVSRIAGTAQPEIVRVLQPHGGHSAACNTGVRRARGAQVLILDSDMLAHPDLVRRHAELWRQAADPLAVIIGAFSLHPDYSMQDAVQFRRLQGSPEILQRATWTNFLSGHVSLGNSLLREVGMFDEQLQRFKDLELGHRLWLQGARFWLAPWLITEHLCPTRGTRAFLERASHYGESLAIWHRKTPRLKHDVQSLGRAAADFGFPVVSDSTWQMTKDRLDRLLVNRWTFGPLLAAVYAIDAISRPAAVRIVRRLYRYRLRTAYLSTYIGGKSS
jgi:glycosyltransferase involved in cell wall biosynthesis